MKRTNISVFVPHYGCPNRCSFCDQRYISGVNEPPSADEVRRLLREQQPNLEGRDMTAEIAFFGGSFTAIKREYMISLLEAAYEFLQAYPRQFTGVRCSTRPDRIDGEILDILERYGVTVIELGAQSMNDGVLKANDRGHTANDVITASRLIKERGFSLGLQMMTGLYKDKPEYCVETARLFAELGADMVRIYPTVILDGTRLGELYKSGEYKSFGFDETVELCAELLMFFGGRGIPVIRLGLHASREVEAKMLGGVYHPALRELTESRIFLNEMKAMLSEREKGHYIIYTDKRNISRVIGQKRANIAALYELGYEIEVLPLDGERIKISK